MIDAAPVDRVLGLVLQLAGGNLDARLDTTSRSDPLDGVIEGLNMLAEELSASTRALQRSLRRSEQSFRSLIEHLPDAILVHRGGRLVYVNAAALEMLGYEAPGEMIDRAVDSLLCFNENKEAQRRASALGGSRPPPSPREGRLFHRSGAPIEVELISLPINFDGRTAQLAIARDIAARKELTAKMMEMDRMIAVGTLAAGVGHEINNPLAYVISNLDFALEQLNPTPAPASADGPGSAELGLREALLEARDGAERVRKIVHDLKTYSRADAGRHDGPVDIEHPLESAISMAHNEIRHRARLVRAYEGKAWVTGNSSQLGQVFLNLLVNAAQAIPEGSAREHRIVVRTRTEPARVIVEVQDSGPGILPEHVSRLFDPFFTTKPLGQGTGLGLFIAKRIVRKHGGELQVESRPGEGSTFRALLPRALRQPLPAHEAPPRPRPSRHRGRVLVIDDEPCIGRALERALGKDHAVMVFTDAGSALKHLMTAAEYDVILCDVMMPDMTGVELYTEICAHRPELASRVLFFTGGAFTPATQDFVAQLGDRCLVKPLEINDVRRRVEALTLPRPTPGPEASES